MSFRHDLQNAAWRNKGWCSDARVGRVRTPPATINYESELIVSTPHSPRRATSSLTTATLARNLKSEWVKLTTLQSVAWLVIVLIGITIGIAFLMGGAAWKDPAFSYDAVQKSIITMAFGSIPLTSLLFTVVGVTFSAGEYSSGGIRTTLTATPRRLPVLWAKIIVLGIAAFTVALVVLTAAVTIVAAQFAEVTGHFVSVGDPAMLGSLVGGAGYLAFAALFALTVGFVVRSHVAAGISIVVGLFFVVPIIIGELADLMKIGWLYDASAYEFPNAGMSLYNGGLGTSFVAPALAPTEGFLVVVAWVAITAIIAAVLFKKRDA